MAFTVGEAARLEQNLVREGVAEPTDPEVLLNTAAEWFADVRHRGRAVLDSETFAFLCETVRFPRDATARALAAGALRVVQRDGDSHPHRAGFAGRFAAHRIRALGGIGPLWSAMPLSERELADAQALFEAAVGDTSYGDDELIRAATKFVDHYSHEPAMFGRLAADLRRLVAIFSESGTPKRHRDIARAALTYFAVAADAIPDDLGFVGLFDDAYVVQRAVAEVCPTRGAVVSLLDDVMRQWPFIRDIVLDAGEVPYSLSEFGLVNSSLLLDVTRDQGHCSRGVALIVPTIGPLPVLMGFVGSLAEVYRHLDTGTWPAFAKGEFLINSEGGAGVIFDTYGRLVGKSFEPCPADGATHICFFARPPGRDKSHAAYNVKCFRSIPDVVSFRRAHSDQKGHGGSAVFDQDLLRLGVLERLFGSSRPIVFPIDRKRIVVVSPLGETRETLETLTIFRTPLLQILPTGQAQAQEMGIEYRNWTRNHDSHGPVLTAVRSASEAAVLAEDPTSRVGTVIAQLRPGSTDATSVARISARGVPVIAILEQRDAEGIEHLRGAGFSCWLWDETWLNTVYWPEAPGGTNPIVSYERRLREQASATVVASRLELPGLAGAHTSLRKLQTLAADRDDELLRLLLGEGFGLLLHLCRMATPLNGSSRALGARLLKFGQSVNRGSAWWSDQVVELTTSVIDEFDHAVTALGKHNPKFYAIIEWATSHPDGQIVCGRSLRELLRAHLGSTKVLFVDRPDDSARAALVPAWLQRERMGRLLFPPVTSDLTLLLYEPEIDWYEAAKRHYLRTLNQAKTFAAERPPFRALKHDRPSLVPVAEREPTFAPEDFVIQARRAHALKYLSSVGGESVPARLVQFAGGYWAAFTELHRVHTVTHLIGSKERGDEEIRETVASELRVGDLVLLLRGTDRDALREQVDAVAPTGTREAAAAWQRALQHYAAGRSTDELANQLAKAGCHRTVGIIERWLEDDSMIGPRGFDDVDAILAVTRDPQLTASMASCLNAISVLRGLHVRMAHVLAKRVLDRARQWVDAGAAPEELIEIEDRLVLATVESIDESVIDVPRGVVNRLQEEKWPG